MFLSTIAKSLKDFQIVYDGNPSIHKIRMMPYASSKDRFMLLLELMCHHDHEGFMLMEGEKELDMPSLLDLLAMLGIHHHNSMIRGSILKQLVNILSHEFVSMGEGEFNFQYLPAIYQGDTDYNDFFSVTYGSGPSYAYSAIGKSGTLYQGKHRVDMSSLKEKELEDLLLGLSLDVENTKIRDVILNEEITKLIIADVKTKRSFFFGLANFFLFGDMGKVYVFSTIYAGLNIQYPTLNNLEAYIVKTKDSYIDYMSSKSNLSKEDADEKKKSVRLDDATLNMVTNKKQGRKPSKNLVDIVKNSIKDIE